MEQFSKLLILLISFLLIACSTSAQSEKTNLESPLSPVNNIQPIINLPNKSQANKILFIGDSHAVGLFGKELFNRLQSKYPSSELYFYAVCGSSPSWWIKGHETNCGYWQLDVTGQEIKTKQGVTPDLKALLQNIKPNLVIVEQGTNLIKLKTAHVKQELIQLLNFIKDTSTAKIFWVGPPDARIYSKKALKATFLTMSKVCSEQKPKITFIDSRKVTHYPASAKDGIHYNGIQGELEHIKWATKVANVINLK